MAIEARFYVHEITTNNTEYSRVVLKPVIRASGLPGADAADQINKPWSKYTPSGEIWMNVHNSTGAVQQFRDALEQKLDFALTFTAVDPKLDSGNS